MSTAIAAPGPRTLAVPPGAGRVLLANYNTVGQVHQNVPLQNLVIGYGQPGYIAEQIMPVVPVKNETDDYYKLDKSPWFRQEPTLVADRTPAREIEWTWSLDSYRQDRYALATSISDRERDNADSQLRLEETSVGFVVNALKLDQEIRVATMLTAAATSGVTLSGSDQFDNANFTAAGVPIETRIDTAKEAIRVATGGFLPTHIVIPAAVAKVMKRDPDIRELTKYTNNNLVNGDLPNTLWDMKVVIPTSIYTTSAEGVAEASVSYSDVWGKSIRVVYVPETPAIRIPATGLILRSTKENFSVRQWRDDRLRLDYFEVSVLQDEVLPMGTGCYVIANAIA